MQILVILSFSTPVRNPKLGRPGNFKFFIIQTRPHRSSDGKTPDAVYFDNITLPLAA
jgi:hypothetical protein